MIAGHIPARAESQADPIRRGQIQMLRRMAREAHAEWRRTGDHKALRRRSEAEGKLREVLEAPTLLCAWCGLVLRPGTSRLSHGICESCGEELGREA